MGVGLGDDVRDELEHRPQREPTDVDPERCIDALRWSWAGVYDFPGEDGDGLWWALRKDGSLP